jgi:hypothetical protein
MDLDVLFNDMADLERENYSQIFDEMGRVYDKEFSITMFREDHPEGFGIIYIYTGSTLTAFLRFIERKKKIRICSLQLKKGYHYQLKAIIQSVYNEFQNIDFEIVETEVWKNNLPSLLLHIKLNFHYRRTRGIKIVFNSYKKTFINELSKYTK